MFSDGDDEPLTRAWPDQDILGGKAQCTEIIDE